MAGGWTLTLVSFAAASSLLALIGLLVTGKNRRIEGRIQDLRAGPRKRPAPQQEAVSRLTGSILPKIGTPLLPSDERAKNRLRDRLIHAGFYGRHAMVVFLGAKMLFIVIPVVLGFGAALLQFFPLMKGALYGLMGGCLGMLLPNFWLDKQKKKRQSQLRRSLPDALDMVIVCLRGGLSLQAGFQRITGELGIAHPLLASEFAINQREIQLGRSTGEAIRHFAERTDLEEIRSLASVILQAERLGASSAQALRIHADTLRLQRLQRAEEMAHKAGTKMVFPTILCIFPSILIVVIGPAAIQIADLFSNMK
jgi:tight adherence protein C